MATTRVAINGFGRIGRAFFKLAQEYDELEVVAINDLGDEENLAYLLKYDSAYGRSGLSVETTEGKLIVDGHEIAFLQQKDPSQLPWGDMHIDVVLESTGFFTKYEDAKMHLDAGAKRVVISAPAKGEPVPGVASATVLMGVNNDALKTCQISSNGSCTTNAASPVMQIMHETIGVEKAMLNTVHGYTASQNIQDGPSKDYRRGRAAGVNIIPTTTGAAIAVTKAITDLEGKFDGMAMRIPVLVGSIADITFVAKRDTTEEEVNDILRTAAGEERWQGILTVTEEPIVSSDIIGARYGAIVDLGFTKVVGGNLVKVLSWYDNEMGYTNTLIQHVLETGRHATA
jgi:glyceraldehyde 3-phosphate dehydrogenase